MAAKTAFADKIGPNWRVHTAKLFAEIAINPSLGVMRQPLLILDALLREVAARAIELDDARLNQLMLQLTLFSVADPDSPDHDPALANRLINPGMVDG